MKQVIIDYPDHVSKTALIDFVTKACHFYFDHLQDSIKEGDPESEYLEELLESVNNMGFIRYVTEMDDVWKLNQNLKDSDYEV